MRVERHALLLLLVLAFAVPVAADPPSVRARADEVLDAVRRDDTEGLAAVAAQSSPDPWFVADLLIEDDAADAALRYAKAGERPDLEALPAYIAYRKDHPVSADARVALQASESAASADAGAAALALLEALELDDGFLAARVDLERARMLNNFERSPPAAAACLRAAESALSVGWLMGAEQGYFDAGLFAYQTRDFLGMLRAWQALPALQRRRGDRGGEALALRFLGNVHIELGELDAAEPLLDASRAISESLGHVEDLIATLESLGQLRLRRGDYDGAQKTFERALGLVGDADSLRAGLLVQLCGVHMALGDYERLLTMANEARSLAPDDSPELVMECEGTIGIALERLGRLDEAEVKLTAVLKAYEMAGDPQGIVPALHNLAGVIERRHDYERAAALRERAVAEARAIPDPWLMTTALVDLAHVETLRGNTTEALLHSSEALELAKTLVSPLLEMRAWRERTFALLTKGDAPGAVVAARKAIDRLRTVIQGLGERQGAEARGEHAELFDHAIRAAIRSKDTDAVFEFIEASRAGSLLESLEGRDELRRAFVPDALRDEETQARRAVTSAASAYRAAPRGTLRPAKRRLRDALETARANLADVVERVQREAKAGASIAYPKPAPLQDVQDLLKPEDALILYALLDGRAAALVVTRETARIVDLGPTETIAAASTALRDAVRDKRQDTKKPTAALRALIVEPLDLNAKRVLLSPDGALFSVPMHALFGDRPTAYVASGTTLQRLAESKPAPGKDVLAFGDPDYANRGGKLTRLVSSGKEANDVGDVVRLRKDATEAELVRLLPTRKRWRAVHLACHGVLDERPLLSALALTSAPPDDGDLTVLEAFQMDVPADLVVLSACETGVGTVFPGEGVVGLTRAFLYAGAPRVVVSLWKVDDEATHVLMVTFHELWKQGVPAAKALSEAQAYVRDHPDHDWEHPYYWAAWVLWGLPD